MSAYPINRETGHPYTEAEWQRECQRIVNNEVLCCMSSIVATLAAGAFCIPHKNTQKLRDLAELAEQAFELASPIPDYEEAALEAGWHVHAEYQTWVKDGEDGWAREDREEYSDAEEVCREHDIEPYDREVFEHWAVSPWLARHLQDMGEKVDDDFGGLHVWARTTTGQAIYIDDVVSRIVRKIHEAR